MKHVEACLAAGACLVAVAAPDAGHAVGSCVVAVLGCLAAGRGRITAGSGLVGAAGRGADSAARACLVAVAGPDSGDTHTCWRCLAA